MTPEQMRVLAEAAANLTVDNDWDAAVVTDVMATLRAAADQLEAAPHTPFCVNTSTPDNPCRCWKSGSTDEED